MVGIEREPVEVDSSLFSLLDVATVYTVAFPLEILVHYAKKSGYSGLEVLPLRLQGRGQMAHGWMTAKAKAAIHSEHQSFQQHPSAQALNEFFKNPKTRPKTKKEAGFVIAQFLLLPEERESVEDLIRIQKGIGHQLPTVLYVHKDQSGVVSLPFPQRMFQPTPFVMNDLGAKDIPDLTREMYARGYTGYCLDLYHFRQEGQKESWLNWRKVLPLLLPDTQEIHVSAGRELNEGPETMKELRDLLEGTRKTPLPHILEFIKDTGWRGRVVTEIPSSAIAQLRRSRILTPKTLINEHQKIVETVVGLLS